MTEKTGPLVVTATGTGSIFFDLAATTAGALSVVKLVLWIAKQALQLRGETIRQKRELLKLESLGVAQDMLRMQGEIHVQQSTLYCQSLARKIVLNRPLAPEDERRLEKAIRDTAALISEGVRLLEVPSTPSSTKENALSDADYDQIESTSKEPLLLVPPDNASSPK